MNFKKKVFLLIFSLLFCTTFLFSVYSSNISTNSHLNISGNLIVNSPVSFEINYISNNNSISPEILTYHNLSVIQAEPNSVKVIDYDNDGKKDELLILDARHYSMQQGFHIFNNIGIPIHTFDHGDAYLGTHPKGKIDIINTDKNNLTKEFILSREDGFMIINSTDDEVFHSRDLGISVNTVYEEFIVDDINSNTYRDGVLIIFKNSSEGKKLHYFTSKNNSIVLEKVFPYNNLNDNLLYRDVNGDNKKDIIISDVNKSLFVIDGNDFSLLHKISDFPRDIESIDTGDFDGDNYQEIFVSTSIGYFFSFNVKNKTTLYANQSFFSQRLGPRSNFFKILDIDNNGLQDDIFYINQGNYRADTYQYRAKKIGGNQYFSKELPQYGTYGSTAFLEIVDSNNDLKEEIIFTDDSHKKVIIINKSGETLFEKEYGSRLTDIAFGDMNNDNLTDYVVTNNQETGFDITTIVTCDISFENGQKEKITWDSQKKIWEFTKIFNESKEIEYEIECNKQGYQKQILSGYLIIKEDTTAPKITIKNEEISSQKWDSSDSIILTYEVEDREYIDSCKLYKNSILEKEKIFQNQNSIKSSFEIYLNKGTNELQISCSDLNGNQNSSKIVTISSNYTGTNIPQISSVEGNFTRKELITIKGIGFRDKPPKLWIYDEFEGVNGTTVNKNATHGQWNTMTHIYNSEYFVSGNSSTQFYSPNTGGEKANINLLLNESFTEVFISYWTIIPPGKRFPGNAETTKTFPSISAWKLLWLNDKAIHGSGHDDMIFPSWGSSSFVITGNDHDPGINLDEHNWWSWDIWNRMNFWAKANKTDPTKTGYVKFESINEERGYYYADWKTSLFDEPEGSTQDEFVRWNQLLFPGWYNLEYPEHFIGLYEDLYVAVGNNSYSHIEITNNKNLSQSTKSSILTPIDWKHNHIKAELNYGQFEKEEKVYLFVFTNEGLYNEEGFEITLGKSTSTNSTTDDDSDSSDDDTSQDDDSNDDSSGGNNNGGRGSPSSSSQDDTQSDEESSRNDVAYEAPVCQSDFSYSAWSSCVNGTQFRIVQDQNTCVDSTQETRVCRIGADENELKELNAKEVQFAKINNRRYETSFSDSYNEMVFTNEKLEDETFVVVDSTTKQQYLGTLVNQEQGKYYYTIERIDQNNLNTLKEQGLAERSLTESASSVFENFKNSRNFKSVLLILTLFGITTVVYLLSRYMKKLHKRNNFSKLHSK